MAPHVLQTRPVRVLLASRSRESGTDALTRRLTLRPEVVVWLDHVQVNLSRGLRHDIREDLCAAAGSGIARTLKRSHSHGWPL